MTQVKIICTIGPGSNNTQTLINLEKLGMNIIRLNGSHNTLDWHKKTISVIRKTLPNIPIIFDIPGTKIRLGEFKDKTLKINEEIVLTFNKKYKGSEKLVINYQNILKKIKINKRIFIDDGKIILKIKKKIGDDLICKSLVNGIILKNKGITFESVKLKNTNLISAKTKKYISFAKKNDLDFLGLSFTKSDIHIMEIKKILKNDTVKIIDKIEDNDGLKNLTKILKVTDGILIDRGDLSSSKNMDNITILQKQILKDSNKYSVPSIIGTGLLNSTIDGLFPSKSEISDITNAVYDGCSAIMLSNETVDRVSAEKSVKFLKKILDSTLNINNKNKQTQLENVSNELSFFAKEICANLPITKIVAITLTGYAARIISHRGVKQKILAVTNNKKRAKSFNLIKSTEGIYLNIKFSYKSTDHIIKALKELWLKNKIKNSDVLLVLAVGYPKKGNKMNLMQVHKVLDLMDTFRCKKNK